MTEPQPTPSRATRCRQLALVGLLGLTVLAWLGKQLGYDALLAEAPFTGELDLGDPQRPLTVRAHTQVKPASKLVVAKVPRRGGYQLGIALNQPDAAAMAGISAAGKRRGALVAINGDYHRQGRSPCFGNPFSTFVEGDAWHALGSPYGYSCQFWLDAKGAPHVGRLDLRGELALPDGPLTVFVNEELGDALLWVRTPGAWRVPEGRVALSLKPLAGREFEVAGPLRKAKRALEGAALLVSEGPLVARLKALAPGTKLTLRQTGADANKPQLVVGTGPRLVLGGEVPASLREAPADTGWLRRAPRTAIGFDDDAVYFVTTLQDPRAGLSLPDFAATLAALGCKEAVNLDGGPSTNMWARGHGVVNGTFEQEVATSVLALREGGVELR